MTKRPSSHTLARRLAALVCCGFAALLPQRSWADPGVPAAPVLWRFATVGDSRAAPDDKRLSAQDRRWKQASPVIARIAREVGDHGMQALVFNGDMVMGYTTDDAELDRQYAFWRGLMATLMERGTYVLPVPGNHEVQMPLRQADGKTVKLAQHRLEDQWRANMGDLILDTARWQRLTGQPVTAWNPDHTEPVGQEGITTAQRQLSYAFDIGPVHLAVINTDAVGRDSTAPVRWLRDDLEAARARGAKRMFVFGHKMAFPYHVDQRVRDKSDALDADLARRDAFWQVIEAYGATYFSGHQHVYHASQPLREHGGKSWQVIVGSGGSPFSVSTARQRVPEDRMHAWAEVEVRTDASARVRVMGFDEHLGPTRTIAEWELP